MDGRENPELPDRDLLAENEALREQARQLAEVTRYYQESQKRFRTVFERSPLGNKIISPQLKILQVNAALVDLLGYDTKQDLIGKAILDFAPPERHAEWQGLQQKLWSEAFPSFSLETVLIRKDGAHIMCRVTSILFKDNDQFLGYTIIENISEQYRLRQQKEEFISVATHELKTPVTTLKAAVQLINHFLRKEVAVTSQLHTLGKSAEKSTLKLTNLIDELLSTTKLEHGQMPLMKKSHPIVDIINSSSSHIQTAGAHQLKIECDHSISVYVDEQKIEQVLVNFINNAVKYAPESKVITCRVEQIPAAIKVTVADSGPGIAPENLGQLFDRYYQVAGEHRSGSGLGLGLYISAEIIRRHGGEIGVDSELGKGSAFWFTLPEHNS